MNCLRSILKIVFPSLLLFILQTGYPQDVSYSPDLKFSKEQLQKDFRILQKTLSEIHPGLTDYISADSLTAYYEQAMNSLPEGLTENEFDVILRKYVAKIKCGHTVVLPSNGFYTYHRSNARIIPINVFIENEKLYISGNLTGNAAFRRGEEIVSINDKAASRIIKEMQEIQAADGNSTTFINRSIEDAFGVYYVLLYGDTKEFSFQVRDSAGNTKTIDASGIITDRHSTAGHADTTENVIENRTSEAKLLYSKSVKDLAILDIDGFQTKGYRKFYSRSFRKIKEDSIQNLVIDLRDDGGGYFLNATTLLSYLLDQDYEIRFHRLKNRYTYKKYIHLGLISRITKHAFNLRNASKRTDPIKTFYLKYKPVKRNHFKGSVYVLTNGASFSISCYTSALLNNYSPAVFIGEETGGAEVGSNGILFSQLELPETRLKVVIPVYHVENIPKTIHSGHGIIPDIPVIYSIRERIDHKDKEMEEVIKRINATQSQE